MSGIFEIFAVPFGWIMWLCYEVIKNYGIALIVFTVITKLLFLPLSIKQQKNSAKMAYFKPKMDAIQKRYAKNQEKMNAELQKLYQEEGYNPMSGCLPTLITFPVLFGVIGVVYRPLTHILRFSTETIKGLAEIAGGFVDASSKLAAYEELKILSALNGDKAAEFISKATAFDPAAVEAIRGFDNAFLGIDFSAIPSYTSLLILIPIFAALSGMLASFVSMKMMKTPDGQSAMGGSGKVMMLLMPVMTFFFAMGLPSGIGFYWIISSLVGALQSVLLHRFYNPEKMRAQVEAEQAKRKEKIKADKEKQAEARKRFVEERRKEAEEEKKELTPEEAEEEKRLLEENRRKLEEARRRDAEKYGEIFAPVKDEDLK